MDIGKKRSLADELGFEGAVDSNRIAAITTWYVAYTNGNYTNQGGQSYRPTQAEALEYWRKNKDILQTTLDRALDAYKQSLGPVSLLGVAYHVLRTTYGDDLTEKFFGPLVSGANLSERNPILVLRNKLMSAKALKLSRAERLGLIFKGWNAWIDEREIDNLYFRVAPTNKTFPVPRDPKAKRNKTSVVGDVE
jgi:hypothetical protein